MATQLFTRSRLLTKPRSRSRYFSSAPASAPRYPPFLPSLLRYRLRRLSAASAEFHGRLAAASSARAFATSATSSTLDDQWPHLRNRVRFHFHCAIMMESEEVARRKIYSVIVGLHHFVFRAPLSRDHIFNLLSLRLRSYYYHRYLGKYNECVGETALFGPAGVYEWNGHDDQPRNFNRSRNFERRENMQNRDFQARDMPPIDYQGMQNPPPLEIMLPPNMGSGIPHGIPLPECLCPATLDAPKQFMLGHALITIPSISFKKMFPDRPDPSAHSKDWKIFLNITYPDDADFIHWLVVMERPEGDPTIDEIIDTYIKTVAQVVKSEEKAKSKIYTVDTGPYYFAFGAKLHPNLAYKLADLFLMAGKQFLMILQLTYGVDLVISRDCGNLKRRVGIPVE